MESGMTYVNAQGAKTRLILLSSALIFDKSGKILLLKRSSSSSFASGDWQLPEGKLEIGEAPTDALIREVKEEVGVSVSNPEFIKTQYSFNEKDGTTYVIVRLVFKVNMPENYNISLSSEHSEYKFFSKEETKNLLIMKGLMPLLEETSFE